MKIIENDLLNECSCRRNEYLDLKYCIGTEFLYKAEDICEVRFGYHLTKNFLEIDSRFFISTFGKQDEKSENYIWSSSCQLSFVRRLFSNPCKFKRKFSKGRQWNRIGNHCFFSTGSMVYTLVLCKKEDDFRKVDSQGKVRFVFSV